MKTSNDCKSDAENLQDDLRVAGWAIESWFNEWEEELKKASVHNENSGDRLCDLIDKLGKFHFKLEDKGCEYKQAHSDYHAVLALEIDPDPTGCARVGAQ